MKKLLKNALCISLAVIMALSAAATAIPAFAAADGAPRHNEKNCYDFSEMNAITWRSNLHSDAFDFEYYEGGNAMDVIRYLACWAGPVDEASHPYLPLEGDPDAEYRKLQNSLYVDDVMYIAHNVDALKEAVTEYGALYMSYFNDWNCFSDGKKYYYCPSGLEPAASSGGHAVAIIGWDDTVSKEKFVHTPERDGAFLCKNSWGEYTCDDGYFYISYCDMVFEPDSDRDFVAFTAADPDCGYNKIYQYDEFGLNGVVGDWVGFGKMDYAANVFPEEGKVLQSNEVLKAVSFYTADPNVKYEAYLVEDYKNPNDLRISLFGSKAKKIASGNAGYAGYHVIDLDKDYSLEKGKRFAIIIKLSDGYYGCELSDSPDIKGNRGESIYKSGSYFIDLNDNIKNSNFCIKAFTEYTPDAASGTSPDAIGKFSRFGINNAKRKYESDVYYTLDELVELGAEINPEYIEYQKNPDGREITPSPVIFRNKENAFSSKAYPAKFDLRDHGLVSTVKDQGGLSSCWAHAAIASFESNALKKYGDGDGIFEDVKVLKTREEQTTELAAGGEVVYKFTAPKAGEYSFAFNGHSVKAQVCSAFGVVFDEIKGKSYSRNMGTNETVYFKLSFADPKASGALTVKADTEYFYDETQITEIKPELSVKCTAQAGKYNLYKIVADEWFEGIIRINCDSELEITLDGKELETNKDFDFGADEYESRMLEVLAVSGVATEFEIQFFSNEYLIANVYEKTELFENVSYVFEEDCEEKLFSFTPEQDGFYRFAGDCFGGVRNPDGSYYDDYDEENVQGNFCYMKAGETYYFELYDTASKGSVIIIQRLADSHSGVAELVENEEYHDALFSTDDVAKYSFTAQTSGYYRFDINISSYQPVFEMNLYDAGNVACGNKETVFDDTYIFDYIEAGETRYTVVTVSNAEEFSLYDDYSITVTKSAAGGYDESLTEIFVGETYEVSRSFSYEPFIFRPEESGAYYYKPTSYSSSESYEPYFGFVVYDEDENWVNAINFDNCGKIDLVAGKAYYFCPQYGFLLENAVFEVFDEASFKPAEPGTLTPETPVKAYVFGEENSVSLPVRAEFEATDSSCVYINIITSNPVSENLTIDAPYKIWLIESIRSDYKYKNTFVVGIIDEYGYTDYYYPDGEPFETVLHLPGNEEYVISMELKEDIYDRSYEIELDGTKIDFNTLIYKNTYTVRHKWSDGYEGKFIYTSSNEDVATVDENGNVTAVGIGSAIITSRSEDGTLEAYTAIHVKYSIWQQLIRFLLFGFLWYR